MNRLLLIFTAVFLFATPKTNAQIQKLFEKKNFINKNSDTLLYRVLYPLIKFEDCIKKDKKYPLVIFLHGAGERGNDNKKQLIHGVKIFN